MANENIKLNFLHLCDYASFGEGGKLNILGIFKKINITKFPATHPQLFIVANVIVTKPGSYKEIIKIIDDENNNIIKPLEFNLTFPSGRKEKQAEFGVVAQVNNLSLSKEGNHRVQIYINKQLIGEAILTVSKSK
ncbi:MAG: hypothetical protein KBG30_13635 [Bacteroidales bacterium]|nr:hypothetical protein [Bacteroidales bacterium]